MCGDLQYQSIYPYQPIRQRSLTIYRLIRSTLLYLLNKADY
nr:MAG TPA: hypothetical protein [Caudoviricetes sp.]